MHRLISCILLIFSATCILAQDNSAQTKSKVRALKSEFRSQTKALRALYQSERSIVSDAKQDELEKAYWKIRLSLKKDFKKHKQSIKANHGHQYLLSEVPSTLIEGRDEDRFENDATQIRAKDEESLIREARQYIGVPYKYGGTSTRGFDCSGFVQHVFASGGVNIPRTSKEQALAGNQVGLKRLIPGDLLFFSHRGPKIDHVGIVVEVNEDGIQMIHASKSSGVIITNVSKSSYWKPKLKKARRIG